MKVYLDDERIAPEGWVQVRWPDEAIKLFSNSQISLSYISMGMSSGIPMAFFKFRTF